LFGRRSYDGFPRALTQTDGGHFTTTFVLPIKKENVSIDVSVPVSGPRFFRQIANISPKTYLKPRRTSEARVKQPEREIPFDFVTILSGFSSVGRRRSRETNEKSSIRNARTPPRRSRAETDSWSPPTFPRCYTYERACPIVKNGVSAKNDYSDVNDNQTLFE